ncbi:MAG: WG repeat-containing protein, partial [Clostridia bacterium]|nr:WG repeat-containing protein [Clostridia bacterium]
MKKLVIFVTLISLLVCSLPAHAVIPSKTAIMNVEGQLQTLEKADVYVNSTKAEVSAFIYNDFTYVPLRAVGTLLNCEIGWNWEAEVATIENELTIVMVQRNSTEMAIKDRRQHGNVSADVRQLSATPIFIKEPGAADDTLYVPVRAISEALSAKVIWNEPLRIVYINSEYDTISSFLNGFAIVTKEKKQGLIDSTGLTRIAVNYKAVHFPNADGVSAVMDANNKWGFANVYGGVIVKPRFNAVKPFSNGLAAYYNNGKWGFVDSNDKIVIPNEYTNVGFYRDGLVPVEKGNKWGFLNANGEIVIPFIYDNAGNFSEGYAAVCQTGKWG